MDVQTKYIVTVSVCIDMKDKIDSLYDEWCEYEIKRKEFNTFKEFVSNKAMDEGIVNIYFKDNITIDVKGV